MYKRSMILAAILLSTLSAGTAQATVCVPGPSGFNPIPYTLGFWANRGIRLGLVTSVDLDFLSGKNLVDEDGNDFDPATTDELRAWLLGGSATNMAYMLSVQLATMILNDINSGRDSTQQAIYAPGTNSANADGFAVLRDVIIEANVELGLHPITLAGDPNRDYQEALKDALDNANNDLTWVPLSCAL